MYSNEIWSVEIRGKARKALAKIPAKNAVDIVSVIQELKTNPFFGDVEKLKGEINVWRRRVGSYRIFYEVYRHTHSIFVYHIERRGSHTYKR